MNIEDVLKADFPHARISVGDRWLYWDGEWVVLGRVYGDRENTCHYRGEFLQEAIEEVLKWAVLYVSGVRDRRGSASTVKTAVGTSANAV